MSVGHTDSVGKIIGYLEGLNFQRVVVSRLFFRSYSCPANCGGCCMKFSLDWFPGPRLDKLRALYPEQAARLERRTVEGAEVFTDWQRDNGSRWCRNLDLSNGRCRIHEANPFSCEFELAKVQQLGDGHGGGFRQARLLVRLYGRGWQFKRVDGGIGARCEILPPTPQTVLRNLELLEELMGIAERMNRPTKLPRIVRWLRRHLTEIQRGCVPTGDTEF